MCLRLLLLPTGSHHPSPAPSSHPHRRAKHVSPPSSTPKPHTSGIGEQPSGVARPISVARPPIWHPPSLFPPDPDPAANSALWAAGTHPPKSHEACRQQIDGSKMLGFDGELRVNRHRRRRRRRKTTPIRTTPPSPEPKTPRRRSSSLFPFPPSPPSTPLLPLPPQESPPRYEIVKRHHLVFFFVFLGRLLLPGPVFPGPPVTSGPRRRFAPPPATAPPRLKPFTNPVPRCLRFRSPSV